MRTITEEENPSDLVTSDVKNPPWGTEPQTPSTATGTRKSFPWTTYSKDYIGLPGSVAQPQRMRTAEHLPRGWPFETTHYAGTFRTPQVGYSRHGVPTPASVHRRNNPHARIQDPWHYPDKTYLVWKNVPSLFPPPRETQSAPPNILQNDKHRWFNTTYKTTFNARPLGKLSSYSKPMATFSLKPDNYFIFALHPFLSFLYSSYYYSPFCLSYYFTF
ncbi:predicted protein [Nematostella vectensis]|uniref:Uncharacterized protein n=1 Tax=Nematostella vectensis TaxID=45351 RepID=A7SE95_NEMVE|nr:predicted protein [Nematostella vectensis]|eukprot:XP_001630034.1 predicted protein [Nematostella vectensis]